MSATVGAALAAARALGVDRLDAQLLLGHQLQRPRSWLLAHDEDPLSAEVLSRFEADCRRRAAGEPLAYVIGRWTFRGLSLQVSPAVLVPRPETEVLVDWAIELLSGDLATQVAPSVVDLGTGSGAIALAVAAEHPAARMTATDASEAALSVARANAAVLGLAVDWRAGDWWAPLAGRRFDLILSNPPYIASGDPHLEALSHEPAQALSAGPDGLQALERIVADAPAHLAPGGWLLLEHGHDQGAAMRRLLSAAGLAAVSTRSDLAGLARCSAGRLA